MSITYSNLGQSGLRVSQICLGTMCFGDRTDATTSEEIIHKAYDLGVNFIDTADGYADMQSEVIVGRAIAAVRDKWVLATKLGSPRGDSPNQRGASRKYLQTAIEGSLQRLGTDYIDVLYLHREDRETPVEETVRSLSALIAAGKIRHYGLSNHRAWRIAEFARVADLLGLERPIASQPCYNLANRQPEAEHLTACAHYGVGVVPYSPLARGVLTGKYQPGAAPPTDSRAGVRDRRLLQTEWRDESLHLARAIAEHAQSLGVNAGQFALAWVLNHRYVTSAVVGPRTVAQFEDYLPALTLRLTQRDEDLVDRWVATGHPSTPGYNDPAHPGSGRVPRNT